MELPTTELLLRYVPSPSDKKVWRGLADEYAVYADPTMTNGIAGFERHGTVWTGLCALRPVLAHALRTLKRIQDREEQRKSA